MAFVPGGGGQSIERARLEVVLEAQNRASAVFHQFGAEMERIGRTIDEFERGASANLERVGDKAGATAKALEALGRAASSLKGYGQAFAAFGGPMPGLLTGAGTKLGGLGMGFAAMSTGPLGMALGVVTLLTSAFSTLFGIVSSVGGAVLRLGMDILRWLGEQALRAIHGLIGLVESLGTKLLWAAGAAAALGAALTVMAVKAAAEMEKWELQFSVLMGSMAAARREIEAMEDLEPHIPFRLDEIVEADRLLKLFDIDLGGVTKTMTFFADVAAAMGRPLEDVIMAWMRLSAGMYSSRLMAPLGLSMPKMAEAGVKFSGAGKAAGEASERPEILMAAAARIWSRFQGMSEAVMQGFSGRITNLQSAWGRFLDELGKPLLVGAKEGLNTLADMLVRLRAQAPAIGEALARALGPAWSQAVQGGIGLLEKFLGIVGRIISSPQFARMGVTVAAIIARIQAWIGGFLDWLAANWGTVWDAVGNAVGRAAAWIAEKIGGLVGVIGYLVDSRGQIWQWAEDFVKATYEIGKSIVVNVLQVLENLPAKFGGLVGRFSKTLLGGLIPGLPIAGPLVERLTKGMKLDLAEDIKDVEKWFSRKEKVLEVRGLGGLLPSGAQDFYAGAQQAWEKGAQGMRQGWEGFLHDIDERAKQIDLSAPALETAADSLDEAGGALAEVAEDLQEVPRVQLKTALDLRQYLAAAAADLSGAADKVAMVIPEGLPPRLTELIARQGQKGAGAATAFGLPLPAAVGGVGGGAGAGGGGGAATIWDILKEPALFQEALAKYEEAKGNVTAQREALAQAYWAWDEAYQSVWEAVEQDPTTEALQSLGEFLQKRNEAEKAFTESVKAATKGISPLAAWDPKGAARAAEAAQALQSVKVADLLRAANPDMATAAAALAGGPARHFGPGGPQFLPNVEAIGPGFVPVARAAAPTTIIYFSGNTLNDEEEMRRLAHEAVDEGFDDLYGREAAGSGWQN